MRDDGIGGAPLSVIPAVLPGIPCQIGLAAPTPPGMASATSWILTVTDWCVLGEADACRDQGIRQVRDRYGSGRRLLRLLLGGRDSVGSPARTGLGTGRSGSHTEGLGSERRNISGQLNGAGRSYVSRCIFAADF